MYISLPVGFSRGVSFSRTPIASRTGETLGHVYFSDERSFCKHPPSESSRVHHYLCGHVKCNTPDRVTHYIHLFGV